MCTTGAMSSRATARTPGLHVPWAIQPADTLDAANDPEARDTRSTIRATCAFREERTQMDLDIPQGWNAVAPEWVTSALQDAFPGVEVSSVDVALVDDGTNRRARLALSYARGSGPATVFVKASDPEHAAVNART